MLPSDFGKSVASLLPFKPEPPPAPMLEDTIGRLGALEVRLARDKKEVRRAQRLRYDVFYKEGGALPSPKTAFTRRDVDRFDKFCDHLIVIDHEWKTARGKTKPKIVGVYRLLRGDMAERAGGFYSATEYDLAPLLSRHAGARILELGRSCVLASHRSKRVIELLWRGLLAYIRAHRIDVMIGCASFPGASPSDHAEALSYLAHYAPAESEWRVSAHENLYVPMAMVAKDNLEPKKAREALSPLIKGYLRLGARFGDGAVVDAKFNTTDVFVVMPIKEIGPRYIDYFEGMERRAA
jgi:L-ornithine Nalpha-acyltransferase